MCDLFMHEWYLSISVYKANNLVSHVKDVPPVKVRHVLVSILLRAIVQDVEDVLASEWSVFEAFVDIIHHCGISDGVLKYKAQYYGTEWNIAQKMKKISCIGAVFSKKVTVFTRSMFICTPSWKKLHTCGPTSSQARPMFLSLSNSSKVVFAWINTHKYTKFRCIQIKVGEN